MRVQPSGEAEEKAEEMVLDPHFDEFYRSHLTKNYGEVGVSVKALMEQFQAKSEKHAKVRGRTGAGQKG